MKCETNLVSLSDTVESKSVLSLQSDLKSSRVGVLRRPQSLALAPTYCRDSLTCYHRGPTDLLERLCACVSEFLSLVSSLNRCLMSSLRRSEDEQIIQDGLDQYGYRVQSQLSSH